MNAVVSCFLWLYIIYHEKLQGGDAASYTSGFSSRLVYDVSFPTGSYTRLIPEMNFACNGVVTGYTVGLGQQNGDHDQDPVIQIWRKSPGSYYKTSPDIVINSALCVDANDGLTEVASGHGHGVFHCNLNQTRTRVSVQAGDILGLYLPARVDKDIAFAKVINGPTNYVFDSQLSMYSRASLRPDQTVTELPQITLEIRSDSNCIRGFPDVLVSEVGRRTMTTNMTTLLIPEMNFICTASVVGFIVSGRDLSDGPHSRVQIWRKSSSQSSGSYYQVGSVSIHDGACVAMQRVVDDTYLCILQNNFQVSVQPGDILGLELPATDSDEILFTNQGPINYIFRHSNQLDSSTNLSLNGSSATAQQLPQIILNLTSAHCLSGFPEAIDGRMMLLQSDRMQLTTRLFPELKFGCFGTIVRVTAAVWDSPQGNKDPTIQIWREDKTHPGLYHKISSIIQIRQSNPQCHDNQGTIMSDILECTLTEDHHIPVQPGDFLGLEIPSYREDDLLIYFKSGRLTNLVFQRQLESTVNLFSEPHTITNGEPQITFLVVIDENADSCPDVSTTLPSTPATTVTTQAIPDEPIPIDCNCASVTSLATATTTQCHSTETTIVPNITGSPAVTRAQASITSSSSSSFSSTTMPDTPTTKSSLTTTRISTEKLSTATTPDTPKTSSTTGTATRVAVPLSVSNGITSVVVGGIVGGIIAILLLVAIVLLTMTLIQLRKRKQYTINSDSDTSERQLHNPIYDGAAYNGEEDVEISSKDDSDTFERQLHNPIYDGAAYNGEEDVEISCKDDTSTNYDHINRSIKKKTVSPLTDNVMYEALEMQHYEMTGPTLATNAEPYIYWEPANTVNDIHKQLSSNKCRELLRQQVKITKALGSGQFSVVSMGVWQSPMGAMDVAVKQLQPGVTEAEKIRFLQEAAINGQFRHPNVVQLMGVVTTGEPAMIVLELLPNGDLRNFLLKKQTSQKHESGGVDKQLLLRFCQHIVSGMSYLASKAFIHRDLAARNILVSKDNICKISDFGMSRDLLDEDYYVSRGGMVPVKWTAPEAIHYKKYSTTSDVWSFGCVMYEIWSLGHKPFESYNNAEVIKMIDKGYRLPPPPGLTKELYKIMIQCWQPERSHRPTFPQLVELLSRADFELFLWEEEDLRSGSDPRVREIGAPLEIATGLYPELQKMYLGKK